MIHDFHYMHIFTTQLGQSILRILFKLLLINWLIFEFQIIRKN